MKTVWKWLLRSVLAFVVIVGMSVQKASAEETTSPADAHSAQTQKYAEILSLTPSENNQVDSAIIIEKTLDNMDYGQVSLLKKALESKESLNPEEKEVLEAATKAHFHWSILVYSYIGLLVVLIFIFLT